MTVEETEDYIKEISKRGSILGLGSIRRLCALLSEHYPEGEKLLQDRIPAIHIAGTNGKGSVGAMLSAIYQRAGFKVGHFSSPAVFQYEEMFRINGHPIEKERLAALYGEVEEACAEMKGEGREHPTLFEVETAAAFLYFWQEGCQLMIIECGMGGAEDATNVISQALACLITSIGKDHTGFLGETLEEIAGVKAGILTEGSPLLSATQKESVSGILRKKAKEMDSAFYQVDRGEIRNLSYSFTEEGIRQSFSYKGLEVELPLAGLWQIENAALVLETLWALREGPSKEFLLQESSKKLLCEREAPYRSPVDPSFALSDEIIKEGLKKVSWPGRMQRLGRLPSGAELYIDGAHNPAAAKNLKASMQTYFKGKRLVFIMGVLADKEYGEVLEETMPLGERLYTIMPDNPRALSAEKLAEAAEPYIKAEAKASVKEALLAADQAAEKKSEKGIVLAFGSLSYLKEVKIAFEELGLEERSCR